MSGTGIPVALAVAAAAIMAWSLFSARLERWRISAPMLFVAIGLLATSGPWKVVTVHLQSHALEATAELALAMVLFTDASRVNLGRLRADAGIPARLLGIGLPLAIAAGALCASAVFRGRDIWMVLLVAVIVAPTDAALGAPVIDDEHVPRRVRRVLNVESGLNDGLATPIFTMLLALAVSHGDGHGTRPLPELVAVAGAVGIGVVAGLLVGLALRVAARHGWSTRAMHPLTVTALPLLVYGLALVWGANGFVATFVAGITFGASWRPSGAGEFDEAVAMAGDFGGILSALVWLMFGAMLIPALDHIDWQAVVFAVLALTLARAIPVGISLLGTGLDRATVGFIAWFGPRGLASVVFTLIAYDELAPPDGQFVLTAVGTLVVASVIAHGVTAGPLAERFGRTHPDAEADEAPVLPSRAFGHRRSTPAG